MPRRKIIFILALITFFLIVGSIIYFAVTPKIEKIEKEPLPQIPAQEKTLEEVLKDLTVPTVEEKPEVSEEIIKFLTAPEKGEVSEDILKELTAPE